MVYQSDQHLSVSTLKRLLFVVALFAVLLFSVVDGQSANLRKYAGIVVDAKTGQTLYSHGADSKRYPASVAKVMTLYIVFEELEAGRLTLDSKLKVSKYAASAVPSKLYLKPGTSITVSDAIKALVTKSANDVARVVAENISGSVPKFADRMTKTARALGMSRTTYKNPSGLPDSRQVTTVRDQARLGMAIFQHYPQHFHYFKTSSFRYRGNTYGNHNRLLRSVKGVDGIKTGYINAAGFNLLTSARVNNRHVIVAAFGFNSGGSRNAKVAELIKKYMPKARRGDYWRQASIPRPTGAGGVIRMASNPVSLAIKGTPPARPASLGGGDVLTPPAVMALADTATPQPVPTPPALTTPQAQAVQVASIEPVAPAVPAPAPPNRPIDLLMGDSTKPLGVIKVAAPIELRAPQGSAPAPQPVNTPQRKSLSSLTPLDLFGNLIQGGPSTQQPVSLVPPASVGTDITSAIPDTKTAQLDRWTLQLGAAHSAEEANEILASATKEVDDLKDLRSAVQPIKTNGQAYFRARVMGFTNETEAIQTCQALKDKNIKCLALPG
ncbi:serine-type D-Ala-D-Ala carboxypeptidase [Maritalea myrionectae]|uniref:Serine-type D-Ala-D-Ala carboxypeptidase n=1 Tax=Maritalea myrionectae TaxID=454601 RepID=A0A2R4MER4_9HYPH|nr:D-alanyl-D-alanine carboxypeptidase [Maritalea myrionectae]AVX04435.1 serine-type D-Ala-D-Ala carboxypeptidase [Maritalea myrionectae]